MKYIGFIYFLIITSFSSVAQEHKNVVSPRTFVGFAPLAIIDPYDGCSIRLYAETKVNQKLSVGLEVGTYISGINQYYFNKDNTKGIIFKPVLKYYFNKIGEINDFFLAIEYQYKYQSYDLLDSIKMGNNVAYEKKYNSKRSGSALNIKVGSVLPIYKRLYFEWYGGAGIRWSYTTSEITPLERQHILTGEGFHNQTNAGVAARNIGHKVFPNLTLGMKLVLGL